MAFKNSVLRPVGHSHHMTLLQGSSTATLLAMRPLTCRRVPCSALSARKEGRAPVLPRTSGPHKCCARRVYLTLTLP